MQQKCRKCEKLFKTYPCRVKNGSAKFCSLECRKKTIKKSCPICNVLFEVELWRSKIKQTCSKECGYKLYSQTRREKKTKSCLTCGDLFIERSGSKGKYCSKQCYWNSKKRKDEYQCEDCGAKISPVKTVKRCFNCSIKLRSGANHHNWKGGISDRDIHSLNNPQYRKWRMDVFTRDGFKCRMQNKDCSEKLQAHHILRWADYPELRYKANNGITLCTHHHPRKQEDEKRMKPLFDRLISINK